MCRTKIFKSTLEIVARETEVQPNDIVSGSRRAEVVDARCILIYFLFDQGLNSTEIAGHLNMTPQSIRRLRRLYDERLEQKGNLIAQNSNAVRTQLELI